MGEQKYIVFIDLDGVLVDLDKAIEESGAKEEQEIQKLFATPGFFFNLSAVPGSIGTVRDLITRGVDCYILSRPPYIDYLNELQATCNDDKGRWVRQHLPELKKKLILARHKHLLAGPNRILLDDSFENCTLWQEAGGIAIPILTNENGYLATKGNRDLEYKKRLKGKRLSEAVMEINATIFNTAIYNSSNLI